MLIGISSKMTEEEKNSKQGTFSKKELAEESVRLRVHLEQEKPYLNADLRLADLGKSLQMKTYRVSELLHRGLGVSFYDLINRLRVEEIQKNIADPKQRDRNLLEIANDCGFNSKSVFNAAFRKFTGMAPSEYRKKLRQKEREAGLKDVS